MDSLKELSFLLSKKLYSKNSKSWHDINQFYQEHAKSDQISHRTDPIWIQNLSEMNCDPDYNVNAISVAPNLLLPFLKMENGRVRMINGWIDELLLSRSRFESKVLNCQRVLENCPPHSASRGLAASQWTANGRVTNRSAAFSWVPTWGWWYDL